VNVSSRSLKSVTTAYASTEICDPLLPVAAERKKLLDAEIAAEDDAELNAAVLIAVNE